MDNGLTFGSFTGSFINHNGLCLNIIYMLFNRIENHETKNYKSLL